MRPLLPVAVMLFVSCACLTEEGEKNGGEKEFVRNVVRSLIAEQQAPEFEIADKVVAVDNGEVLSKEDFKKAWLELRKVALKEKVSLDDFFASVRLQIYPVTENKRLMNNKRVVAAYKHEDGDLYCDASQVKEGVKSFIGYAKAFVYVIRKVNGKWTLVGIGG
ncbi:MAG: hypothetical protein NTW87_09240 [Planctomycetota bacterium]|nr:hypothetical protein [Planctomycetota bacterium]